MPVADIQNILGRISPQPQYITQEVVAGDGETIQGEEYTSIGDVHEYVFFFNWVRRAEFEYSWNDVDSATTRS